MSFRWSPVHKTNRQNPVLKFRNRSFYRIRIPLKKKNTGYLGLLTLLLAVDLLQIDYLPMEQIPCWPIFRRFQIYIGRYFLSSFFILEKNPQYQSQLHIKTEELDRTTDWTEKTYSRRAGSYIMLFFEAKQYD